MKLFTGLAIRSVWAIDSFKLGNILSAPRSQTAGGLHYANRPAISLTVGGLFTRFSLATLSLLLLTNAAANASVASHGVADAPVYSQQTLAHHDVKPASASASILSSQANVYIAPSLQDGETLSSAIAGLKNSQQTFHLFSHGKPGVLLVDGQWLDAQDIVHFLQTKIDDTNTEIAQLNIYGCDFAQGANGLAAVNHIEEALGLSVSASTNVTGVDGDWLLEVGNQTVTAFNHYSHNLQILDTGSVNWTHNETGAFPDGSPRSGDSEEAVITSVVGDMNNIVASTVDGMLGPGFTELNQFFGFGTAPNQIPVPAPANEGNIFEYFLQGADSANLFSARINGDYVQYAFTTVANFDINTRVTLDRLSLGSVATFQGGNNFNDYSVGLEVSTDGFATAGQVLVPNFFRTRDNSAYNFIEGDLLDFELASSTTYTFRMYVFNDQGVGTTGDDRGGFGARFTDAIGRITIDDELFQLTRTRVIPPEPTKTFSPTSIRQGGTSTLTIVFSNLNATGTTLTGTFTDTLPAGMTVAAVPNIGGTCSSASVLAAAGSSTVVYNTGASIPVGGCSITVDVTSSTLGNSENIIGQEDLVTGFGTNTTPTNAILNVQQEADLELTKVIVTPEPYFSGDTVEYTITVTNNGPDPALNVLIEDLPDGLTIVSASSTNCTTLPCFIGNLAVGAVEVITVMGTVQ